MIIAIDENDTFRKVLWRNQKAQKIEDDELSAAAFLIHQIKTRRQALVSQAAMK